MSTFVDDIKELVDKQRSDVNRAFLGLHSPYLVREEYRDHSVLDATLEERKTIMKSVKVLVDPTRYQEVPRYRTKPGLPHTLNTPASNVSSGNDDFEGSSDMGNLEEDPVVGVRVGTILECLEGLLDTFAKKDVETLADKAVRLQTDDGIRTGFDKDTFFVRSTSTSKPHIVKRVGAGFSCDKECLGFVSRKICAQTVAAAAASHCLLQFISWFKKSRRGKENLTSLTTFYVNRAAGKK
ncbi:unnamed protein product, partial [Porites lobata]